MVILFLRYYMATTSGQQPPLPKNGLLGINHPTINCVLCMYVYIYCVVHYSLNLCKEVVDGLRITFDHVVELQLLYAAEREQHGRLIRPGVDGRDGRPRARHTSARSDRTGQSTGYHQPQSIKPSSLILVRYEESYVKGQFGPVSKKGKHSKLIFHFHLFVHNETLIFSFCKSETADRGAIF